MKLTDKRIWKFEAAMLLCGVATVCIEALSYGISLFYLIGQLLIDSKGCHEDNGKGSLKEILCLIP